MSAFPNRAPGRAAFAFIFVTVTLDMLAVGIIVPILPRLIVEFEGGNTASAAMIFGVFGTAWAAMQFLFSPLIGVLSDRVGRRPIVLLSNLGLGLDYVLMALAPNLWWLFVGRLISGFTAASFATAGAYIADITPAEQRAAKFGLLGAAFGLGFVLGPAVGGLLGEIDLRLPFWVAAGLSLVNACYGFFILPESLPRDRRISFDWSKANPLGSLTLLQQYPALLGLASAAFLSRVAHDSLHSTFVLYGTHRYSWSESTTGFVLAAVGIATVIVQAGLMRPVSARYGDRNSLLIGFSFGVAGFLAFALAPSTAWFMIGVVCLALFGLGNPALQSLMTQRVGPTEQGQLQGALASLGGISGMMAPVVFTQVFAAAISPGSLLQMPGAPFVLAALALLLGVMLAWRATRPRDRGTAGRG